MDERAAGPELDPQISIRVAPNHNMILQEDLGMRRCSSQHVYGEKETLPFQVE